MQDKLTRSDFSVFYTMETRWSDNDIYGHVNNVEYYGYFDSAVNRYLIEQGQLQIHIANVVGFVVESKCQYFSPIAYPETIDIGLRVSRLSQRSVTYELGIFQQDSEIPSAQGYFVHVFVNRNTNQAVAIPDIIRQALEAIKSNR
ncbi:thioesterase family protein [Aliiglaciecola litoralis]|uniref:Thioesterase family protein n=1 Tax=Aliiglaciecola litoralis TaxID=582857 RepID=A0ABN1LHH7_9ALTE